MPAPSRRTQQAEATLRLETDPIRERVRLSIMLRRQSGFPAEILIADEDGAAVEVGAYDDKRYDDLDISWHPDTLTDEIRVRSTDGRFEWIRSQRAIHLFAPRSGEVGKVSVPAAILGVENSIICEEADAGAVLAMCESAGSPHPTALRGWEGIPSGWTVLTGYVPARSPSTATDRRLSALDPGLETEIELSGGLQVYAGSFAEGAAPAIRISQMVDGARITIDGQIAVQAADATWMVPAWDAPGWHLIDVVPGPSRRYEIIPDPGVGGEWDRSDSHPNRFRPGARGPWTAAAICGAHVFMADGRRVVAAEASLRRVIGPRAGVAALRPRNDVGCTVGLASFEPMFLIKSRGKRRSRGVVVWLGRSAAGGTQDPNWADVVRHAAGRRLSVQPDGIAALSEWRAAVAASLSLPRPPR